MTNSNDTVDHTLDKLAQQRTKLKARHASALAKLMDERDDLSGVNALADLVSESLRWTA